MTSPLLRTLDEIRADRINTADTRLLLVNIHRWARTNGWQPAWCGWTNTSLNLHISWDTDSVSIDRRASGGLWGIWQNEPRQWPVTYRVTSVRQAVDILCAISVLPAEFSSQYAAGRRAA